MDFQIKCSFHKTFVMLFWSEVGWVLSFGKEVSEGFETERKSHSVSIEGSLFLP